MSSERRRRFRERASCAYILAGLCALASGPAVGYAQMSGEPGTANDQPATQTERAERMRQPDQVRATDTVPPTLVCGTNKTTIVLASSMSAALAGTRSAGRPSAMLRWAARRAAR